MTSFGRELVDSAHEALAIARGAAAPARVFEAERIDGRISKASPW